MDGKKIFAVEFIIWERKTHYPWVVGYIKQQEGSTSMQM